MAGEENPVEITINRLQQEILVNRDENAAYNREEEDYKRLQYLSVANTSGDTLVIVKFPDGDFVHCNGRKWNTKEFLMESEQLLATGSSVFAKQLSPKAQAQTRRHLSDRYKQHRYVLDLTPQIEGDESASEVAQLSLSDGVIDWWKSHFISNVSKYLVSGHDDNCPYHFADLLSEDKTLEKVRQMEDPIDIGQLECPSLRKILDYCPIRHRAAILRLLVAIRHGDLVLNSAARVATMAVVAKQFDCVNVVKDPVLTWFMAEPNQNFIDINAEDALKIAWILELPAVTRVAFQVLVAERAIEIPNNKGAGIINKKQPSIFGRPRGSVTDEQETCIQHAAQKLIQRAEDMWDRLLSDDVNTYLGIKGWPIHDPDLCKKFRTYIHGIVSVAAKIEGVGPDSSTESYDWNRARFVPANELVSTKDIYANLLPVQRILTCHFWKSFNEIAFELDVPYSPRTFLFDNFEFREEVSAVVNELSKKWLFPKLDVNIEQTGPLILSLSDEEFKFLPLWAGGLDDGTGRVYQPEIPDAERGFPIGPGPRFYTGETIPDDDTSTSEGEATTIYTGVGTVTMTEGYSVQATRSQTTMGPSHEDAEGVALTVAAAGLSLTTSQRPTTTSNAQENTASPNTRAPDNFDGDFDWMADGSEYQDLSDLDGSDSDSDENNDDADNARNGENSNTNANNEDHQSST
ncbi:hypothetical protein F4824DRAFT_473811 [Ustulina deusta]|nr:hypothetical protein F4824DRAFT_473811 [Ustulina deusta]